ncbi:MAG TPA: polysaccharide deacetylase family protein [Thermoclostridium caenicola]|nr:polysaccharide deacetylase family protein [Thermoclostridium caenicola]
MKVILISRRNLTAVIVIAAALFFIAVNMLFARDNLVPVSGSYREDIPIYSVETDEKKCAITFDCAWGASDIPNILDTLDKYHAKATFFIVGLWAEKYPDMVKLIADRGHEIANHGYSHLHMASIPEEKIAEEITRCTETLEKVSGQKVKLFRPPYGEYNAKVVNAAKKLGYHTIQWDCDSLDWKKDMSRENIFNRVVKRTEKGSIILFHNDTQYTQDVLPEILDALTESGFEFVTVSDLLIKGPFRIRYDGRQVPET